MKILLISDIHIRGADDPFYRSLLTMIERDVQAGDVLVFGGDIFDFFVGKQPVLLRRYSEFFQVIAEKLKIGARVEYIEGNHDFHLRTAFRSQFGDPSEVRIHDSEVTLSTPEGRRLYVAHGDLVDREDRGYLFLRSFFRSPFIRFVAYALPGKIVEKIGEGSSEASRRKNPRLPEEKGKEAIDRLRKKYREFAETKFKEGYDGIVMGHCHDLDEASFSEFGRKGQYMNIGFPRVHRSYVVFTGDHGLERKPLP